MSARPAPLLVGVALVAAGLLILLRNLGILPAGVSAWPIVLIAVGVVVLVLALRRGPEASAPSESAAASLDGAVQARMVCKHGAGPLEIAGGAAADRLFEGTFAGGIRQEAQRVADRLEVTLRHPSDPQWLFRRQRGLAWLIALSDEVPLDLEVHTGASRVRLDLSEVLLRSLRVQTGASDVDIRLPAHGQPTVTVSAGAADVRVHVPEGMSAAIANRSALANVSIDQARFPRSGDGYRDPAYELAADRAVIELDGGVASFAVD